MKRRWMAVLMVFTLVFGIIGSSALMTAEAATVADQDPDWIRSNLVLMGILDGAVTEEDYDSYITRGEFAKMLVQASSYKDKVDGSVGASLYSDVKYSNAYTGYIKLAVEQSWMTGYLNGTFKPAGQLKMKEAARAVLGLLGYSNSDFTGNKVNAQMAKLNSLGLNDGIGKMKNQVLTWQDAMQLFYNLMSAETKTGKVYGETLGYSMDSNGDINYLSVLKKSLSGPVLAEGDWRETLPVDLETATIFRNESASSPANLQDYDVLYYSEDMNIVWAYDNKVTGSVTEVSPNRTSPETITVAGSKYTLGTQKMIYDFSALGEYQLKETVTLFLGMDDQVAAVKTLDEYSTDVYGVLLETGSQVNDDTDVDEIVNDYMVIVDVNGNEHTYYYDSDELTLSSYSPIYVTYEDGEEIISKMTLDKTSIANSTVDAENMRIGTKKLASDVKILDVYNSSYVKLYPEDLDGVKLYSSSILYFEYNEAGEICSLILYNVSGGSYSYGVVTAVSPNQANPTSYTYMVDGKSKTVSADKMYGGAAEDGACAIVTYENGSIYMNALIGQKVTSLTTTRAKTSAWTKTIADNVAVYYEDDNGNYYQTTLAKIRNLSLYEVTAYYDTSMSVTNEVKVLIARDR